MKLFALSVSILLGSSIFGKMDTSSRYYNREISTDEYVDSLIGPVNTPRSYYGEIRPNQFGGGYNYVDTDGGYAEVRSDGFGGWNVKGCGY